jgi:hypothetical protein
MSDLLLQYVKAQDLPRVLSGDMKLADLPVLGEKLNHLMDAMPMPANLPVKSKVIPLLEV